MNKIIILALTVVLSISNVYAKGVKKMTVEQLTRDLVVAHEGFRAKAYVCPAGKLTIGYGFTDKDLVAKGTITKAEADRILNARIAKEIAWVKTTFPKLKTDKQIAAVADLAFNIGHDRLCWKTVNGKRVHTNAYNYLVVGNIVKAVPEICEFRCSGGKVLAGLVNRRNAEKAYLLA